MRALLDTNVFLSYLLNPDAASPPARIGRYLIDGRFAALVAAETIDEIREKVDRKPYLAARISAAQVGALLQILDELATLLPPLQRPVPAIGRDIEDDYLLVQADQAQAEVLVSGDNDLLALKTYHGIRILSPAAFVAELERLDRPPGTSS